MLNPSEVRQRRQPRGGQGYGQAALLLGLTAANLHLLAFLGSCSLGLLLPRCRSLLLLPVPIFFAKLELNSCTTCPSVF